MQTPIRVVHIIQAYYPHVGGAEKQLAALAPLLKSQGVEVHIFTRRYPGLAAFETVDGVPVYRLPIPGPKAVASLSFTLSALPLLRRLRPNLIHAHELLSPTTTAVLAKKLFSVPVVVKLLRGGHLGDLHKLQTRRFGLRRLASFKKQVAAFITISQEIDQELAAVGVPARQRPFIPNGVDTDRFAPLPTDEKQRLRPQLSLPDGPLAVFTGRLVPEKRVDQLIQVWTAVQAAQPNASLLICGEGPEEDTLRQMAGQGVIFAGRVDDVAPYLQTADLFILPSATEGLSNALLEGMAAGLGCIATRVGGAADLITHQKNGWLLEPDQPEQLQQAILTLLANEAERRQMGLAARQKVVNDYGLSHVASQLRQLYTRVIAKQIASANLALEQQI